MNLETECKIWTGSKSKRNYGYRWDPVRRNMLSKQFRERHG